jgi:peptidylprolyl isomerase
MLLALMLGFSLAEAKTLVTVNGESITQEEMELLLSQSELPDFNAISPEDQKRLIESMVERKLLAQHAQSEGIEENERYQKAVAVLRENLMIDIWLEKYASTIPVSDAEAKKLYEENRDRFSQPEQVRARHILVESKAEAEAIISDLKRLKGTELEQRFSEVAQERSVDPGSGQKGGDLGFFARDRMVKPFADAAFEMEKGEITRQPVKSDFGFHVIYLVDRKPAMTRSYEDVAEQMKNAARMQKFEEHLETLTDELRQDAEVTYPN